MALGYGIFATFVARLDWGGEQLGVTRIGVDRVFLSPDGSLAAGELVFFTTAGGSRRYETTRPCSWSMGRRAGPAFAFAQCG